MHNVIELTTHKRINSNKPKVKQIHLKWNLLTFFNIEKVEKHEMYFINRITQIINSRFIKTNEQ